MLVAVIPAANAGCRDFPESVTPLCAAQNLAEEQARQAEAAQAQIAATAAAEEAARANAERDYTTLTTPEEVKVIVVKRSTTITCIKGKVLKKVTGVKPKCPTGYKKK